MGIKRLPWVRRRKKWEPELPLRAPLPLGPMSNGEFFHPDNDRKRLIRKLVHEHAETMSRKHRCDRREFLASAAGVCTTLAAINFVEGCSSKRTEKKPAFIDMGGSKAPGPSGGGAGAGAGMTASGGRGGTVSGGPGTGGNPIQMGSEAGAFAMPDAATEDPEVAECVIGPLRGGKQDLIVDMQAHFVNPQRNPLAVLGFSGFLSAIRSTFTWTEFPGGCEGTDCYSKEVFIDYFFGDSDTSVVVISGIPYVKCAGGSTPGCDVNAVLTDEDVRAAKVEFDSMLFQAGVRSRVLTHAMVMPNDRLDAQLGSMELNAELGVNNWKLYPGWATGGAGSGYWVDDPEVGIPMLEQGRKVGVPIFCIHKGFPLGFSPLYVGPRDIGPAAKMYPDLSFVIYHSSFEYGIMGAAGQGTPDIEGPWPGDFDGMDPVEQGEDNGVNALVKSLKDAGIGPNGADDGAGVTTRVYAEIGGTWPSLMTRPREASHVIGKLLKYVGEDRVVWGTDSLWVGSPRPCIEAFRSFQILPEHIERYGYPELTLERKAKILGLNAARLQGISCDPADYPALALREQLDHEWGERRYMALPTPGPRTRRQFLQLQREEHAEKVLWSGYGVSRRRA